MSIVPIMLALAVGPCSQSKHVVVPNINIVDSRITQVLDDLIARANCTSARGQYVVVNALALYDRHELRAACSVDYISLKVLTKKLDSEPVGYFQYKNQTVILYDDKPAYFFDLEPSVTQPALLFKWIKPPDHNSDIPYPPPIMDINVFVYTYSVDGFELKEWGWYDLFP